MPNKPAVAAMPKFCTRVLRDCFLLKGFIIPPRTDTLLVGTVR
jgi:hypothetical protein